jgi:hypothetical protein
LDDDGGPRRRAWLTREDGSAEDASDRIIDTEFFDRGSNRRKLHREFTVSGW